MRAIIDYRIQEEVLVDDDELVDRIINKCFEDKECFKAFEQSKISDMRAIINDIVQIMFKENIAKYNTVFNHIRTYRVMNDLSTEEYYEIADRVLEFFNQSNNAIKTDNKGDLFKEITKSIEKAYPAEEVQLIAERVKKALEVIYFPFDEVAIGDIVLFGGIEFIVVNKEEHFLTVIDRKHIGEKRKYNSIVMPKITKEDFNDSGKILKRAEV